MTNYLEATDIGKLFGDFAAVQNINFQVSDGEFICILGPSGCGKTTLLRVIAGLETQSSGKIIQNGKDISLLPPDQRDFGIVFQSYALFPNLTVKNNIAFGLETRKYKKQDTEKRVVELLNLVGLSSHINKYPSQLSGGEQQRVALARALAPSPSLLLLDEPLSALDAKVRQYLRLEIKDLQMKLGITTIMVTHDQEEALTMADRIILMNEGKVEQIGTPFDIYSRPKSSFSANFIGTTNLFKGKRLSKDSVEIGGSKIFCICESNENDVVLTIRPEDIKLNPEEGDQNIFKAEIKSLEFLGSYFRSKATIRLRNESMNVICNFPSEYVLSNNLAKGGQISISLQPECLKTI